MRQLVHDSSHAERAPPPKIGAAISLRRPEARRPLVRRGEETGGGVGGGRVQLFFHPLSSSSSASPHQHGPFGVLSGAVVGGAIKSWWERQTQGSLWDARVLADTWLTLGNYLTYYHAVHEHTRGPEG